MRSSASAGAWFAAALVVILSLLHASSAAAQVTLPTREGLIVGRFVLYPSLTMEYLHDSNVLFASKSGVTDDIIASNVRVIRPRILVDLPIGGSRIRWSYSPVYRDFASHQVNQTQYVSHFLDFEGNFKMGSGVDISITDHFVRGTTELREVDPGGETTFGLVPFTLHEPQMTVDLAMGARHGISIIPRYASTRFDDLDSAAFFGYRRRGIEGRYNYKVGPLDTLYGYYALDGTNQQRPGSADISQTARTVGLGLKRVVNQVVTSWFSAGYKALTFEGGPGEDYSGAVIDVSTTWQPRDTMRVELSAGRSPYPSFFENNNFYLDNGATIRVLQQIGQSMYWTVSGGYQANRYPHLSPIYGVRRRDKVLHLEAGFGRQFLRALRVFVGYNRDRRDSNVEPATYSVERVIFRIELGWL